MEKFTGASFDSNFSLNIISGHIGFDYENPEGKQSEGERLGDQSEEQLQKEQVEEQQTEMQENKEQTEEKQSEQQSEEVQILFSPDINEIIIGSGDLPWL